MTVAIENRNQPSQHAAALPNLQQLATRADSSDDSSSASISANDFLTLLVTEMQNQDPTANTDPNEYINQLVNVNSLEQLISINQELSGVAASSGTETGTGSPDLIRAGASGAIASPAASAADVSTAPRHTMLVDGNLGLPDASSAADRVAQALGGGRLAH